MLRKRSGGHRKGRSHGVSGSKRVPALLKDRKRLYALYVLLRAYFEGHRKLSLAEGRASRRRARRHRKKHKRSHHRRK